MTLKKKKEGVLLNSTFPILCIFIIYQMSLLLELFFNIIIEKQFISKKEERFYT